VRTAAFRIESAVINIAGMSAKTPRQIAEQIISGYRAVRNGVDGEAWLTRSIAEALAGRGHALPDQPQPRRRPIDLILCTGMPRSGSTWSYNACMSLLESAHPDASIAGLYSEDIRAVLAERSADYLVIKCHAVDEAGRGAIGRGECRTVYTYRDPREAVASFMVFADHSFDEALASIKASLEFMTFQRRYGDALLISYTELTESPRQAIRRIADHLGPAVDDAAVTEADRRSSREEAAAVADKVETFTPAEVYRDDKYLYHRRSLVHRNHLAGGGARWQSALTAAQIIQIRHETRFWADLFGG
jgi:hypothetical protein